MDKSHAIEFLNALKQGVPQDQRLIVATRNDSTSAPRIRAYTELLAGDMYVGSEEANNYTCVMSTIPRQGGSVERQKVDFGRGLCLLVDDLGEVDKKGNFLGKGAKVPLSIITPLTPTALIETSPHNYQALYFFDVPLESVDLFEDLIKAFIWRHFTSQGKPDPGQAGVNRLFRIPFGINNKPDYLNAKGEAPQVRLAQWNPELRYTPREIVEAFDLDGYRVIREQERERAARLYRECNKESAELDLIEFKELVGDLVDMQMITQYELDNPVDGIKYRMVCPWEHEHSTGRGGTYLMIPSEDNGNTGWFHCNHGHCLGRGIHDVFRHVASKKRGNINLSMLENLEEEIRRSEMKRAMNEALYNGVARQLEDSWRIGEEQRQSVACEIERAPEIASTEVKLSFLDNIMSHSNSGLPHYLKSSLAITQQEYSVEWVVKNLYARKTVNFVYGGSFTGKTYFVMDMGLHIANGMSYFDKRVKGAGVLYVAAEGAATLQPRFTALHQVKGFIDGLIVSSTSIPLIPPINDPLGFDAFYKNYEVIVSDIVSLGIGMIIIDTLSASLPMNLNENDNNHMAYVITALRELAERTNTAVVVVHHTGKAGGDKAEPQGMRGASSLFANADTVVAVTVKNNRRTIVAEKNKFDSFEHLADMEIESLVLGHDDDGDEIKAAYAVVTPKKEITINLGGQIREATERHKEEVLAEGYQHIIQAIDSLVSSRDGLTNAFSPADITLHVNILREDAGKDKASSSNTKNQCERLVKKNILVAEGNKYALHPEWKEKRTTGAA